VIAFVKQKES